MKIIKTSNQSFYKSKNSSSIKDFFLKNTNLIREEKKLVLLSFSLLFFITMVIIE